MDGWDKKCDLGDFSVFKIQDQVCDFLVVQKCVFIIKFLALQTDPGILVKIVIGAQVILVEDFIDGLTAIAAKVLFVKHHMFAITIVAAMVASFDFC